MARVIFDFEDAKETKEGGWIKINKISVEPPIDRALVKNGILDDSKCTMAQVLANQMGLIIQKGATHSVLKGGK